MRKMKLGTLRPSKAPKIPQAFVEHLLFEAAQREMRLREREEQLLELLARAHEQEIRTITLHAEVVRELEAEIARLEHSGWLPEMTPQPYEDEGGNEPEIVATPGGPVRVVPQEAKPSAEAESFKPPEPSEGELAFRGLVALWMTNWSRQPPELGLIDGPAQPDRYGALLSMMTARSGPVLKYVRAMGGLVGAVHDCLLRLSIGLPEHALTTAKHVASEMVALGSRMALPLDQWLEKSMFTDPEAPPTGGLAIDAVKFDTPLPQGR